MIAHLRRPRHRFARGTGICALVAGARHGSLRWTVGARGDHSFAAT
jgi:hypothetical protein